MSFKIGGKSKSEVEEYFGGFVPRERRVSELRRDLVTGSWVVLASSRLKRPHEFRAHGITRERTPKKNCSFENPQAHGNEEPVLFNGNGEDWSLQVIPNKYPAFSVEGTCVVGGNCTADCGHISKVGPYSIRDGYGFHEILIIRNHDSYFAKLSDEHAREVVYAYRARYQYLKKQDCIKYISIFENHGRKAGASIYHPHAQIMAMPFLPSDVKSSLRGSRNFYNRYKKCVHCEILKWELQQGKRVIYNNDGFVAICPFVSFGSFEIRIYPKIHQSRFDELTDKQITAFARAFKASMAKLDRSLKNPPYNYFIHTAPINTTYDYAHYHWHLEILPAFDIAAGFELGTGVQILTISPERAAQVLNKGHF